MCALAVYLSIENWLALFPSFTAKCEKVEFVAYVYILSKRIIQDHATNIHMKLLPIESEVKGLS